MMTPAHIAISGGGPAGLLLAILLSKLSLSVTVLEQSLVADPWTSRSYSINLNPRGLSALDSAGVLEDVQARSMIRRRVILESATGEQRSIPRDPPHYALTRPDLVECLETVLKKDHSDKVKIVRGVTVSSVKEKDDGIEVLLDNGSTVSCTHLVGADGKWSAVRKAMPDWKGAFAMQTEPAFGVFIKPSKIPERWQTDATTLFRPFNPKFYVLAAPLLDGKFSITAVCFDEIKQDHPWLVSRDDQGQMDWELENGEKNTASESFRDNFSKLLKEELPMFYRDILGSENLKSVRVNRKASWLKPLVDNPSYCSKSGRVVLIGDAAHAMTASVGEGCNCALESAVLLVNPLQDGNPITLEDLTRAFRDFGAKRPSEVLPVQARSAEGNRFKKPEALSGSREFK